MAVQFAKIKKTKMFWDKAREALQQANPLKADKREYTIMLVPHQGEAVVRLRIPVRAIKISAITGCALLLIASGLFLNYQRTINQAAVERNELLHLREVTGTQDEQLKVLAEKTSVLQEDVTRLNLLDAEIRRMVEAEGDAVSRAGNRNGRHNGQGGVAVEPKPEQLVSLVDELQANAKLRGESLAELKQKVAAYNARLAVTPSIWPTNGTVTSRFGWRQSPFGLGSDWHPGIDIANSQGTYVVATADGQVVMSNWFGGYGKCVQIDHGYGITTLYGHNSQLVVSEGEWVKKGQLVAYMGSTGASTGSHVHYEVRVNGTAVNPNKFL